MTTEEEVGLLRELLAAAEKSHERSERRLADWKLALAERDEARAEVERLKEELENKEEELHPHIDGCRSSWCGGCA